MTDYGGFTYPTLSPYVFYEDLPAALDFLAAAFGFTERMRNVNPDGSLSHCEIAVGDSVLMLGTPPDYENPARSGHVSVACMCTSTTSTRRRDQVPLKRSSSCARATSVPAWGSEIPPSTTSVWPVI